MKNKHTNTFNETEKLKKSEDVTHHFINKSTKKNMVVILLVYAQPVSISVLTS